jgi:hypothetical protein
MSGLVSITQNVKASTLRQVVTGVICGLRRIQSSRYEIGLQMRGGLATETTYTSLVCLYITLSQPLTEKWASSPALKMPPLYARFP